MPIYLWDVKHQRTRLVKSIREEGRVPDYVAISHTWGRWRKPDEWTTLPGVPWRIPLNSRIDVQNLPTLLQALPYDFVWIDLLTIPQEETSWSMTEIQKTEISRQAVIFHSATSVIAWFNDVQSWGGTEACLRWLSLNSLKSEGYSQVTPSLSIDSFLNEPLNKPLFHEFSENPKDVLNPAANPWFTSLWTLQEACIRPDIIPCNARFEPLRLTNDCCVSLADIMAMLHVSVRAEGDIQFPFGVLSLTHLMIQNGLLYLLKLSPPNILWLGKSRHCQHRRAEAIMSALGTTDWFQTSPTAEREKDLVLQMYPLSFLNEVRQKLGHGVFFYSGVEVGIDTDRKLLEIYSDPLKYTSPLDAVGSLLPIGFSAGFGDEHPACVEPRVEHQAVRKWVIEKSGCVRIQEVGVLTPDMIAVGESWKIDVPEAEENLKKRSTRERLDAQTLMDVVLGNIKNPNGNLYSDEARRLSNVDLQTWIDSYKPEMPNYLVCIFESPGFEKIEGVVLKEINPGILVRIGIFSGMLKDGADVNVASQQVDWLVL